MGFRTRPRARSRRRDSPPIDTAGGPWGKFAFRRQCSWITDVQQFSIALAPPVAVLVGILLNNARLSDLRADIDRRFSELRTDIDRRFKELEAKFDLRFNYIDQRFDHVDKDLAAMAKLWESELGRVRDRVEEIAADRRRRRPIKKVLFSETM